MESISTHGINTTIDDDFLDCFHLILTDTSGNNSLKFYCPLIDANQFDYLTLQDALSDAAAHYCLSRRTWEEYKGKPMRMARLVKDKFRKLSTNDGELGELMLFSFLESDLKAPKIATKMELKTNPNMYFNGADGVHYLKLSNGDYQLIFGESKAYSDLMSGISAAIDSIQKFCTNKIIDEKTREVKGITFEKGLINAHLVQESFSEEDREFLKSLIYPKAKNTFFVDTAFAVFVLHNINISDEKRKLGNHEFRDWLFNSLKSEIQSHLGDIYSTIQHAGLNTHSFYFYLVPFDKFDSNRKTVLEGALR